MGSIDWLEAERLADVDPALTVEWILALRAKVVRTVLDHRLELSGLEMPVLRDQESREACHVRGRLAGAVGAEDENARAAGGDGQTRSRAAGPDGTSGVPTGRRDVDEPDAEVRV